MSSPRPLTGRTVLIWLIAFFGLVGTVNGVFIFFAIESWPGLSQQDAYKTGVAYNRVLDEARAQAALGWRSGVDLGADGAVTVRIADAAGKPVSGLTVTATFMRPTNAAQDSKATLTPEVDGGYHGRMSRSLPGAWSVDLRAVHADGRRYRMVHDIQVKP